MNDSHPFSDDARFAAACKAARGSGLRRLLLVIWMSWLGRGVAVAAEIIRVDVGHQGEAYTMEIDALADAPAARVRAMLTDYDHLDRLNNSIKSSRILDKPGPGEYRVRIVTHACVWFFCRTIKQVQSVREAGDGWIDARVVPELSDFKQGWARFAVQPEGATARIRIVSEVEPGFWIPPVIGPWLIKLKLRSEVMETLAILEKSGRAPS